MDIAIARIFVIKKAAEIFNQTVNFRGDPAERAATNWREAERYADANLNVVSHVAAALTDEDSYHSFEIHMGEDVWHAVQPWRNELPRPPYGSITYG